MIPFLGRAQVNFKLPNQIVAYMILKVTDRMFKAFWRKKDFDWSVFYDIII